MQGPWTMVYAAGRYLVERWRDEREATSMAFDEGLGVETRRWTLGGYEPTPIAVFDELMAACPLPEAGTFVDVGAGKGRVLMLAARRPFDRVVGVERNEKLAATGRRNLRAPDPLRRCEVEVLHLDATELPWPLGPLVVFLYNPFVGEVLHAVLDRLEASLRDHPRPCAIGYLNPLYLPVLTQRGWTVAAEGGEGQLRWVWCQPSEERKALPAS